MKNTILMVTLLMMFGVAHAAPLIGNSATQNTNNSANNFNNLNSNSSSNNHNRNVIRNSGNSNNRNVNRNQSNANNAVANNVAVSYKGNEVAPSSVFAPSLTSGTNPCVVSSSGGISTMAGGISLGHAYVDSECQVRESLRLMGAMVDAKVEANGILLREISCQSIVYWEAMKKTAEATGDSKYVCLTKRPSSLPIVVEVYEEEEGDL